MRDDGNDLGAPGEGARPEALAFAERLKSLQLTEETQTAFANRLQVSLSGLKKWLSGTSLPGLDNLVSIHRATGVSIDWLATGQGEMLLERRRLTLFPTGSIDERLLITVMTDIDAALRGFPAQLGPVAMAKVIAAVYDEAVRERTPVPVERIRTYLRLVA